MFCLARMGKWKIRGNFFHCVYIFMFFLLSGVNASLDTPLCFSVWDIKILSSRKLFHVFSCCNFFFLFLSCCNCEIGETPLIYDKRDQHKVLLAIVMWHERMSILSFCFSLYVVPSIPVCMHKLETISYNYHQILFYFSLGVNVFEKL